MRSYKVRLESPVSSSFRCTLAAQSLDIDVNKKSVHELNINADIDSDFNIGLIVGASGSGKTTLAKQIFGNDVFSKVKLDESKPIIEQLPKELSYDECAQILSGIGLTSVPCWIRPVYTLSNGQKARAEAALAMLQNTAVIDEWTSVVDRTVAKVMSHCVQKFARKNSKQIILLSCHYDVIEWLNPDWIIDCNTQKFIDRRLLQPEERIRTEKLTFEVKQVDRSSWKYFSKYHYLSEKIPGGHSLTFGLFHGGNQIGFNQFSNYVPHKDKSKPMLIHSNRIVIHPDFSGFGLGILFTTACSKFIKCSFGYKIYCKFSSMPTYVSMQKSSNWKCIRIDRQIGKKRGSSLKFGRNANKSSSFRTNIKTYTFQYIGE